MSDIGSKIRGIIKMQLGCNASKIVKSATFSDLGADSLDVAYILMETEETFDICISEEDAEGIKTVGDLIKYVRKVV